MSNDSVAVIEKDTGSIHDFGAGFVGLGGMFDFMKGKDKDKFDIKLGRFENERESILAVTK